MFNLFDCNLPFTIALNMYLLRKFRIRSIAFRTCTSRRQQNILICTQLPVDIKFYLTGAMGLRLGTRQNRSPFDHLFPVNKKALLECAFRVIYDAPEVLPSSFNAIFSTRFCSSRYQSVSCPLFARKPPPLWSSCLF